MRQTILRFLVQLVLLASVTACSDQTRTGSDADAVADTLGDTESDVSDVGDAGADADDAEPGDVDLEDTAPGDVDPEDTDLGDRDRGDLGLDDADRGDLGIDAAEFLVDELRIVAANLTSGTFQRYEAPGIRILQGLAPDLVLIQEFRYANEPVFQFGGLDGFVAGTFGEDFFYYAGPGSLPNGIVSRYPIAEAGTWDDATLSNREFDWARIDIPGDRDLWAISLHLKASSGDAGQRNAEAAALVAFINDNVPDDDYLVVGGDLNTQNRAEACLDTLSSVVDTGAPWPVDGAGDGDTNASRTRPYDWVLTDADLGAREISVAVGEQRFAGGLVVDTGQFAPLADIAPAEVGDSAVLGMQHMAVVRDFRVSCTPRAQTICQDDASYWQDDCGNVGRFRFDCECGCDSVGAQCRPCACEAETCNGAGSCSLLEGAARCECDPGCLGEYCDRCGVASQRIAVGPAYACAVEASGRLACWGFNNHGQSEPPGGTGFTHVDAGWNHACALDSAGRIVCWGQDTDGRASPPSGGGYVELALSQSHGCARRDDGRLACWGYNGSGQATPPGGTGYLEIAAGTSHTCAISAGGGIACWGDPDATAGAPSGTGFVRVAADMNRSCALDGTGTIHCWGQTLTETPPSGGGFTAVAIGAGYGLVLDASGGVVCWGVLCDDVTTSATGLTDLVSGDGTSCALTDAGAPRCWGYDFYGAATLPPTDGVAAVSAGYDIVCRRSATGELDCFGFDLYGRTIPPAGTGFGAFEVASTHGCALTDSGAIACWGSDDDGRATPPSGADYQAVAVGVAHSCALDADDRIVCWGRDLPGGATAPDEAFSAVSAGASFTCGLRADTSITCWGSEIDGKLDTPEGTGFATIFSRGSTSCAIRDDDGGVACWGAGTEGVSPPSGAFSQVAPGASVCARFGGEYICEQFSCGVRADGSLACWGTLGRADLEPPEGGGFAEVSAGSGFMCALSTDGVLQCWGELSRPPALDVPEDI